MRQPARVLESADVRRVLKHVLHSRYPKRNRVIVLLSFKAGLRSCEIAGLTWEMTLTPSGRLADELSVARQIAKNGSGRRIPLNPDLKLALTQLHVEQKRPLSGPVVRSERDGHMRPRSVVNWFKGVYVELGLLGCSSHSGRRTFITRSARILPKIGASLRDVQELAGHRSLTTTERYIVGDRDAQRRLTKLV
ncbi:site-specific integrase [Sphingomonas panacisoli]|uniref:Site-specific integrase n=1 Tax=Sphingomonas panacisoli TaxID=1813879 RepID=A0A5B8LEA1_9SPHN|nr:site-specific integrase [Sphingomonas panacisoli]QDZ06393.1 site-specific integrase [Sphingomonas panacisoli]